LLVGSQANGKNYAKLAGAPGVFTLSGMDAILNARPFALLDKFSLLINIETVDTLTISGGDQNIKAEIKGKGDDAVYSLNGKKAEAKSFKKFYQAVIGLRFEAEYPGPPVRKAEDAGRNITVEFLLNDPSGVKAAITLVPYDRDFYSVSQEGTTEFLISRNKVREMYSSASEVSYE